mgnify:CR=1 FL=1
MGRKQNWDVGELERVPLDRKLTRDGAFTILLLHPRIPQNTGSIARMCAGTGSRLDLVAPFFDIEDSKLKRAGLDYWPMLDVRVYPDFEAWELANPGRVPWLVEVGGPKVYAEAKFAAEDVIAFGDEQDGIDPRLLARWPERHLRIPQQSVRSHNLATSVGVVTYEALRQVDWLGLE